MQLWLLQVLQILYLKAQSDISTWIPKHTSKAENEFCISLPILFFLLALSTLGNSFTTCLVSPYETWWSFRFFLFFNPPLNLICQQVLSALPSNRSWIYFFLSRATVPTPIYATAICWHNSLPGLFSARPRLHSLEGGQGDLLERWPSLQLFLGIIAHSPTPPRSLSLFHITFFLNSAETCIIAICILT